MKTIRIILSAIAASAIFSRADAQDILIAAWEFSNVPGDFAGNTIKANFSDQAPGDGEAADGEFGTMYADGSFGSSAVDNMDAFTFLQVAPDSLFNSDVLTSSRPLPGDLSSFPPDGAAGRLVIADGSFGGGGAADPSGAYLVFATWAPEGETFGGPVLFSSAIGIQGAVGSVVEMSYSFDGTEYIQLDGITVTTADQNGPSFSIADAAGKSALYVRFKVPSLGISDSLFLDNIQFVGSFGTPLPGSFWSESPEMASGWRFSGEGYPGEVGIGYIQDANWPYVAVRSLDGSMSTEWLWIRATDSRAGFYAWVPNGGYWIYGMATVGWYYSWSSSAPGWHPFVW